MISKKEIKWVNVARRGKSHPVLFMDSVIELYRQGYFGRAHKVRWNPKNYRQYDDARWFGERDLESYQVFMEKASGRKTLGLLEYANQFEKRLREFRKFAQNFSREDFAKYSNKELITIFKNWFEHTKLIWSFAYDYIFINKFLPDKITAVVAAKIPDIRRQNEYLGILFQAENYSEIVLEKRDLVSLAEKMRKSKISLDGPQIMAKLEWHLEKYAHLGFYYFRGKPIDLDEIRSRLKQYLKMPQVKFREILGDINKQNQNRKTTLRLFKELNLNREVIINIKEIKRWAWISSFQDETYGFAVYKLFSLWSEISRRLGVSYKQFYSLTAVEIMSSLSKGHISNAMKDEASARHNNHAIVLENGKKLVIAGKRLSSYARKEKKEEKVDEKIKILRGQPASPGFARGKVKTVFTIHDVGRVDRGDVLVAYATNPTFVPAMEKAAAIVADEGGLLSHAAIVSRELKIPCVVGTKMASRIFKDGDLVEVDANKGIIRKIS